MVTTKEMFADVSSPTEIASRFEAFKNALDDSARQREARKAAGMGWVPEQGWMGGASADSPTVALDTLSKSLAPELLASVRAELDKVGALPDLSKDISLTSPLSTGLVPYDLEVPAKWLAPVLSPLRNRIPRVPGKGLARRFKRITGISGSGSGGVANLSPFINDTSTISVGSLTLRRGPKISYASDEKTINYKQLGLSDVVTWSAEFAGLGFTDVRQLSQTALLYASMLADERALLAARGTDSGFVGALTTPATANVTLTVRTAGVGEVGNSANIANLFVRIAGEGMFGESIASAEVTSTGLSATTGKVVDVTMTGAYVAGVTGWKIYVGTVTGLANQFFAGRTGCWGGVSGLGTAAFTIQFTGAGTGGTINTGANGLAADTSASADAFDGILSVQLDPTQSGAIYSVGGKLSTSNPGVEWQNVFAGLYSGGVSGVVGTVAGGSAVKGRPSLVLVAGADRKQLSNAFLTGGSGNPTFFLSSPVVQDGMRIGQVVVAILNEVTGDEVGITVEPWLNQGVSVVMSESLPVPDSQVPYPFQYCLPQDYMGIPWPVIQHTYDQSTYWFGALVQYAPMFSGAVNNILAA